MVTVSARAEGVRRAERFIIFAVGGLRAVQLTQAIVVTAFESERYHRVWVVAVLLAAEIVWSAWCFVTSYRRAHVIRRYLVIDVGLACFALLVVSRLTRGTETGTWTNWSVIVGLSSAMLGPVVLRTPWWVATSALLVTAQLVGALPALTAGQASVANELGNGSSFFALAVLAYLLARYLRSTGLALDAANQRAFAAEIAQATEQARYEERVTQYRTLHDTVLSTLTAISRGGLDYRTAEVRARCAREADYLRRLLSRDVTAVPAPQLATALADVIDEAAALGLRVHYLAEGLPDSLPPAVVEALAGALREALTNVRRHSGDDQAWVTATGDDDRLSVRVVDRGRGFDQASVPPGLGMTESIHARLADSGGIATITSRPGEGTLVELMWPR